MKDDNVSNREKERSFLVLFSNNQGVIHTHRFWCSSLMPELFAQPVDKSNASLDLEVIEEKNPFLLSLSRKNNHKKRQSQI